MLLLLCVLINGLNFKEFTYEKQTIIDYSSDTDFL